MTLDKIVYPGIFFKTCLFILYCWSVLLDHSLARHHSGDMAQSADYEDLSTLHLIVT